MKIKVNQEKEINKALKLELVWNEITHLERTLEQLCRNEDWQWNDERVEKLHAMLNDFAVELADSGEMAWQLEEKEYKERLK